MLTDPSSVPAQGAISVPSGTLFRLWSTRSRRARVVLYGLRGQSSSVPMTALGEGHFEAFVDQAEPGTRYFFELDGQLRPDPYARCLPHGVHSPATVWTPPPTLSHRPPALTPADLVISEVQIATFTPEGTFRAAQARLALLREVGITAVQLLPIAAGSGLRSGDGVAAFAPRAEYGTPDDLMALVDEAHRLGMVMLLDLALGHLGPDGNDLGSYSPEYLTARGAPSRRVTLDGAHPHVHRLALDCADHWLRHYRFDGLRLAPVQETFGEAGPALLSELATQLGRLSEELGTRYFLFTRDAGWDGLLAPGVLESGDAADQALGVPGTVYHIPFQERIGRIPRPGSDRPRVADLLAVTPALLFSPMIPLLSQGQEWLADVPGQSRPRDPEGPGTAISGVDTQETRGAGMSGAGHSVPGSRGGTLFRSSALDWDEREQGDHARALTLHHRLLELRRTDPVLRGAGRGEPWSGEVGPLWWIACTLGDESRVLLMNRSAEPVALPATWSAETRVLLKTQESAAADHLPGHSACLLAISAPWTGWPADLTHPAAGVAGWR